MTHKPVLLKEVIENLNLKPGAVVVDGTLGAGGHSIAIFKKILPGGKLISIDWDRRAVENFENKLRKESYDISDGTCPASIKSNSNGDRKYKFIEIQNGGNDVAGYWCGVNDNFANLDKIIKGLGINYVDAIFADLGFSSDQIEDAKRGFSFLKNGPLDMRYSQDLQGKTAADIINNYPEKDLVNIFWRYGEERYSRKIAKGLIQARKIGKIGETGKLVKIISESIPSSYKRKKIHFATKVFQALRIEANQELSNLKKFLDQSLGVIASGGRLAVISFHSLEDRIVKNFFRDESRDCICPPNFPKCICAHKKKLKIITKKPIVPGEKEIRENPRARSAKLRVAEKISMNKDQRPTNNKC